MTAIPSHKNNNKCTNKEENILKINSDIIDIQSDAQVIQKDNVFNEENNNDVLVNYKHFNIDEYVSEHNLNSTQHITGILREESIAQFGNTYLTNSNFKNDLVAWAAEYQIKHKKF